MKIGGVQKSLCNLLWELDKLGEYDVTLALFNPVGAYIDSIPPSVHCIYTDSLFRYFGVSQGEMCGVDKIKRGVLAAICRIINRDAAVWLMRKSQKRLPDTYDCAIAFLHNGRQRSFYGGVQDFVLYCVNAHKKITWLHDDYNKCGANNKRNKRLMEKFDKIAPCSNGCGEVFLSAVPEMAHKTMTVRNCNNISEIRALAQENTVDYDNGRINVLCAARLSPRKGIDRAIEATQEMLKRGIPITLHILGSGIMEVELKNMVAENGLSDHVIFHGEQSNPYRYMKNADLFLLTSYREAAPMVIDEAYILGVPVLTTRTNSSDEMVTDRDCGWVCENNQTALNEMLYVVLQNEVALRQKKEELRRRVVDNTMAVNQFKNVIEG